MGFTQDLLTGRRNIADGSVRIGDFERLWYSSSDNTIRIGDGVTPGGIIVCGGSSGDGNYVLPTASTTVKGGVKIDGTTIKISNEVISGFDGNYNSLINKPSLFSGSYTDLTNKPTIPAAQVNSDWNATSGVAQILNKPDIVAITDVFSATNEPMGHEDITNSAISFSDASRTFTITPVNSSYNIWVKGTKIVITSSKSVTIPNTNGLYYIYFDSTGSLQYKTSFYDWPNDCMTAYVYWNALTGNAPFVADERHGITLDWQTHEYLHRTRGASIANGFSASNYIINGDGSLNSHLQLDISSGTFFDEDLQVDIVNTPTPLPNTWQQDLSGPSKIPMFFLNSEIGWVMDTPTAYPIKQGTLPKYNLYSGGVWSTPDIANNKFGITFIIATNNINYPVIGIIGQSEHANQGDAEAVNFTDLSIPGFPIVEFRLLYKIVYQCKTSYTNAVHARLASIFDLRIINSSTSAITTYTDHGSLSGLLDDDHTQYLLRTDLPTTNTGTATKLQTARNINGVAFDGSADITVTAAAGTLSGTTLKSTVVSSSLTSVGTLSGLTSGGTVSINNAGAIAHGAGQLFINGSTYSRIDFSNVYAAPVANDRSTGTRLLFNPGTGLGRMDSAIGMSSTALWSSVQDPSFSFGWYAGDGALGSLPITLMTLSGSGILTVPQTNSVVSNSATKKAINLGVNGQLFDDGQFHIHSTTSLWLNSLDSSDINIGTQYNSGSGSTVNFGKNIIANSGSVTANASTAFIAGSNAASNVALQLPSESAIRNLTNGSTNMYFDVSNGGSAHGAFVFRSSSSFTSVANMSPTAVTFNSGATVTSQTPVLGRTSFNVALDTVVTVDNLKYRISNLGGVFPQVASASGSNVDVCYDVLGVVNGAGTTNAQNSGYILLANGTWVSIYSAHGMDARGDRLTAHITDKNAGKIYRVTYMKTNNSSNADGYNVIVERIM